MDRPFFSIVIPTYNRCELLKRCLDSIIAQTYDNWEAIVVDNFSEDDTEKVVMSYHDNRIRYIKNHNYGVISISRNKGIDLSCGDWICFLDSDDCWFPQKLEEISKYTEDYDMIYHEFKTNIKKVRPFQSSISNCYTVKECNIPYILKRGDPFNTSSTAISKQAIGLTKFSEDKKLFAVEDYDFFLQLIEKNIRIFHLKKALTLYDVNTGCSHGRFALDRDRKIYIKYRDRLNRNEIREVIKYYYLRKAGYFYKPGSYLKAFKFFTIAGTSKSFVTKKRGLLGAIKSLLLLVLDR